MISLDSIAEISRLQQASVAAQVWPGRKLLKTFCRGVAHLYEKFGVGLHMVEF